MGKNIFFDQLASNEQKSVCEKNLEQLLKDLVNLKKRMVQHREPPEQAKTFCYYNKVAKRNRDLHKRIGDCEILIFLVVRELRALSWKMSGNLKKVKVKIRELKLKKERLKKEACYMAK